MCYEWDVDIGTVIKAIIAPFEERRSGEPPTLMPGDRLVGRVLRLENDGRILISLAGQRALAQTAIDVKPGQSLQLLVVASGPPLHLRLEGVDPPAAPVASLADMPAGLGLSERRELLSALERVLETPSLAERAALRPEIRQVFVVLKEFLEPLVLSRSAQQVAAALRHLVDDSGVLYERKLLDLLAPEAGTKPINPAPAPPTTVQSDLRTETALPSGQAVAVALRRDLKPNLLLLKAFFEKEFEAPPAQAVRTLEASDMACIRRGVAHMLGYIDQQQERAVQRSAHNQYSQMVIHWLPVEDQARAVGLRIHYPKAGDERTSKQQVFRVTLLLQMDRLGPLRVDLAMLVNGLRIDFQAVDARIRDAIDAHMDEIRDVLGPHFESIVLAAHVSGEKIAKLFQEEGWDEAIANQIDVNA
jgi:hypothetical protein